MIERYQEVRKRTEDFCKPLKPEDYVPQPVVYASPAKWHLAHTTWFFEEFVLKKHKSDYQVFHKDFAYLFNSYYNGVGERVLRANRGNMTRPTVEEVYAYRHYVDEQMLQFLEENPSKEIIGLIELGLNHEEQHQELLTTDVKHTLGHNPLFPVYKKGTEIVQQKAEKQDWISIPEDVYEIGFQGEGFCYDNELAWHKVYLHDFEISSALVSNGEYMEFMEDDGYERFELWLDEGWAWVNDNEIRSPLYWHKLDGGWHQYTFGGLKKVQPENILCHISFYEANAFANWKGMRLPTEFEWEAASHRFKWGERWEWTNSAYLPYPGFKTVEGAVGEYNGKFMVNQMVLRGASAATSRGHSRNTYRNFFHPHYQWQFTGIRLAK